MHSQGLHQSSQFQGQSKFYTWLVRIAVNEALMKLRRRRPERIGFAGRRCKDRGGFGSRAKWRTGVRTRSSNTTRRELKEILSKTIQGLPPSFRTVFVLRDVEGLSTERQLRRSSSAFRR